MTLDKPSLTLAAFLLERIAEDEAVASVPPEVTMVSGTYFEEPMVGAFEEHECDERSPRYLTIHPARVLAECEAKRRIVEEAEGSYGSAADQAWVTLCHLATVYADNPEFRPEWAL